MHSKANAWGVCKFGKTKTGDGDNIVLTLSVVGLMEGLRVGSSVVGLEDGDLLGESVGVISPEGAIVGVDVGPCSVISKPGPKQALISSTLESDWKKNIVPW